MIFLSGTHQLHSATGLDGVSLYDLKSMPTAVLDARCRFFRRAEENGEWPSQVLVGSITSLAKTAEPDSVPGLDHIAILLRSCCLWSGVREKLCFHQWVTGVSCSAINHTVKHPWFGHIWHGQLKRLLQAKTHLAGKVADIENAFGHLPREVVFQTAVAVGLPFPILKAWAAATGGLERRFRIREHLGPPVKSSTGFPEGCAMSCLAMMLMDCLFHKWFEVQFPLCQPASYVDDLQLLTCEVQQIPAMLCELHSFSALVDLTVDKKKTFTWCTSAYYRSIFRRQSLPVKKRARGLGAQLKFGKLHSTEIIRRRIEECKPL